MNNEVDSTNTPPHKVCYPLAIVGSYRWEPARGEPRIRAWAIDANGPVWKKMARLSMGESADLSGLSAVRVDGSELAQAAVMLMFDSKDRVSAAKDRLSLAGEPGGEGIESVIARLAIGELPSVSDEKQGEAVWPGALRALVEARELSALTGQRGSALRLGPRI